ncbi:MFS transporter [Paraburkholderia bannensis]|nr:MFS transporter [Paraburkholderia bannensis]
MPFLMLCYVTAYLDRINIGFAKLRMLKDLGLSDAAYGFGAGLFFIGYLIFEIPSNVLMARIGAKKTISRIMILWGLVSAGFAFVSTPQQFYVLRFLLGVAEAGFYPGIILYLTYWFPSARRAKMVALFVGAVPLSGMIGAPISGAIMATLDSVSGFAGWQWLFVLEAIPSLVFGILTLAFLDDGPTQANWLSEGEKSFLRGELEADRISVVGDTAGMSVLQTLKNRKVWHMTLICFCSAICSYGVSFWLPTLVAEVAPDDVFLIGLYTAIPFAVAFAGMYFIGRSSDAARERRWHLVVPFSCVSFGLVASVTTRANPELTMTALCVAALGAYSTTSMLFSIPGLFLTGVGMAAGVAFINCVGGLGGFVSPYVVGAIKDSTGSTDYGIFFISLMAILGVILALLLPKRLVNR